MTHQTTDQQHEAPRCAFCGNVPPPPAITNNAMTVAICLHCVRDFAKFDSGADLTALRASLQDKDRQIGILRDMHRENAIEIHRLEDELTDSRASLQDVVQEMREEEAMFAEAAKEGPHNAYGTGYDAGSAEMCAKWAERLAALSSRSAGGIS